MKNLALITLMSISTPLIAAQLPIYKEDFTIKGSESNVEKLSNYLDSYKRAGKCADFVNMAVHTEYYTRLGYYFHQSLDSDALDDISESVTDLIEDTVSTPNWNLVRDVYAATLNSLRFNGHMVTDRTAAFSALRSMKKLGDACFGEGNYDVDMNTLIAKPKFGW